MTGDIDATSLEEDEGRCHAVLEDGSRCPNPPEPGERYCGLPDHQSLADVDSDHLVAPAHEVADRRAGALAAVATLEREDPDLEPGGGVDEASEESAAAEDAAAIGGPDPEEVAAGGEVAADPAARAVLEGGGGEAAGQEQIESDIVRAVEEAEDADLSPDGQGFEEPHRRP